VSRCLTYRVCFTHRVSKCFDTRETFSRCFRHEVLQTSGASLDLHHSRITPHAEEIRLQIMTTAKISTSFPGSTRTFPTRFHGSSRDFHGSKRESPSLKRVDRKTVQSGDANILHLISSGSGVIQVVWCVKGLLLV